MENCVFCDIVARKAPASIIYEDEIVCVFLQRNTWQDKEAYDRQSADLAARFKKNFAQFTEVGNALANAGPR